MCSDLSDPKSKRQHFWYTSLHIPYATLVCYGNISSMWLKKLYHVKYVNYLKPEL